MDTFASAGNQAGAAAANEVAATFGSFMPAYLIADLNEGYNAKPTSASEWADYINSFVAGVQSVNASRNVSLRPAFYCGQSDFIDNGLDSLGVPAFLAVDLTDTSSPVTGANVKGYDAFYASCPAGEYVSRIVGWHARWNTIQWPYSARPSCGPQ